jgi:S1-C subfamily serine protease
MNDMPFSYPDQEPTYRVRGRGRWTRPAIAAALVLGVTAASAGIGHALWPASSPTAKTVASGASVATNIDSALVDVTSTFGYQGAKGAGTGIVLTSSGEVLTNNHVIDGATSITVTDIGNGKTYTAAVVGYDKTADVAVLQLQGASGLATAKIGDSSRVTVGQTVLAVGNAGGVGGTPSSASGTVTALGQAITASDELDGTSEQLSNLIETNANIQPGDSGGALVDSSGEVIGMDTAAASGYSLQSASNQGYAIPINQALSLARQIESGKSTSTIHVGPTAFLGVLISSQGSYFGSPGATVSSVVPGSAAAAAGISQGDVITSVNGHTVDSATTLSSLLAGQTVGSKVTIGWTDSYGQSHTATVALGSGPPA